MCITSGAGFDGYKRMLGRKKRYTEPAGMKEWSEGGQKWGPATAEAAHASGR